MDEVLKIKDNVQFHVVHINQKQMAVQEVLLSYSSHNDRDRAGEKLRENLRYSVCQQFPFEEDRRRNSMPILNNARIKKHVSCCRDDKLYIVMADPEIFMCCDPHNT